MEDTEKYFGGGNGRNNILSLHYLENFTINFKCLNACADPFFLLHILVTHVETLFIYALAQVLKLFVRNAGFTLKLQIIISTNLAKKSRKEN